jgi:hypothetical protein
MSIKSGILIKPYTLKELAAIYGMNRKTMSRWLEPHRAAIGKRVGYYYSILQVNIILDKLGTPGERRDLD